jgi:hypothetical protein
VLRPIPLESLVLANAHSPVLLCRCGCCPCLQIAAWLAARALQLDATTGQLPEALQLLELAVDKGYGPFQVQVPDSSSSSSLQGGGEEQQQPGETSRGRAAQYDRQLSGRWYVESRCCRLCVSCAPVLVAEHVLPKISLKSGQTD